MPHRTLDTSLYYTIDYTYEPSWRPRLARHPTHDGRGGHFCELDRCMRALYMHFGLSSAGRKRGSCAKVGTSGCNSSVGRDKAEFYGCRSEGHRTTTFKRPHRPLAHRQTTNLISVSIYISSSLRITMGLGVCECVCASYVSSVITTQEVATDKSDQSRCPTVGQSAPIVGQSHKCDNIVGG